MGTDSSSEDSENDMPLTTDVEAEESRVHTKRRRSSSLASYTGSSAKYTAADPSLEAFLEAHKVGRVAIFGKKVNDEK